MGSEVLVMNLQSICQKVASGTVNGIGGQHKFHFMEILPRWMKIDVREALAPTMLLMMENLDDEQSKVKDCLSYGTRSF